jgi:hypothetical protein
MTDRHTATAWGIRVPLSIFQPIYSCHIHKENAIRLASERDAEVIPLYTHPATPVAVSEAMVAAGAKAIWDSYSERLSPRGTWEMALTFTDYARIAITAALAASPTEVRDG